MAGVSGGWGASEQAGGLRKGPWTAEEDRLLHEYVDLHGEGRWSTVARSTGLNRSGKSCRLRWVNYLKPGLKKGQLTPQEQAIIIELHSLWGNKWSMIARCLPGRTDNEIKNYWRTHFKKADKFSRSEEKPKNRAMRRQKLPKGEQEQQKQLQLQQQQHQQEEQQDKQAQQHQAFEDKNIQSDEMEAEVGDGYRVSMLGLQDDVQDQEMFMCSSSNLEDQCLPVMFHQGGIAGSIMPGDMSMCGGDEGIWSGLWNLEDDDDEYEIHQAQAQAQAHFDRTRGCSSSNNKVTMQNQNQFIPSNFYGGQFK